jgi:phosphoglycolate phosphatase
MWETPAVDLLAARAAGCSAVILGTAQHDGGLAALQQRGAAPDLHFENADELVARLRALAHG